MKPALPGFFRDSQHVLRIARPFEAVNKHQERRAPVFSLLPVTAAQESRVRINLKMSILSGRQGEPPEPEVGRNGHSVAVFEQSVWHERLSCIERHLSNLSEPPAQNKLTPGNHAAVLLTVVAREASIHVQGM
jgi:hypothetical protein